METLTQIVFTVGRSRTILQNLVLLAGMGFLFTCFLIRASWASEIVLVAGCTDAALMPPGGGGLGAMCEGGALCYSSDGYFVIMGALCYERAYCTYSWVLNDVIVDSTTTKLRCRGTGVDLPSGRSVHVYVSAEGCDPSDVVPLEFNFPMFFNCSVPLPPGVCFLPSCVDECESGLFWNFVTASCEPRDGGECCVPTPDGTVCCGTPIMLDVKGNGLALTDGVGGVDFDLDSDGHAERRAWSEASSDDGWLALDRNGNSLIDSGAELFGNFTPQSALPAGMEKNGFLALAEFDKPIVGGNADGVIDNSDAVFSFLRVWQDVNHNGISEPIELHTLSELDLTTIDLKYKESKRTDEHGNRFRYRGKVNGTPGSDIARWAWDVFLVSELDSQNP